MKTYRKIHILFADEEPAAAYSDESIAQVMLERCEEWQEEASAIYFDWMCDQITTREHYDKEKAHKNAHPLHPSYANAQDYALKTVFLHE